MKCLLDLKKAELLDEAIKMRLVLVAITEGKFSDVGSIQEVSAAALCFGFSRDKVDKAISVYSVKNNN